MGNISGVEFVKVNQLVDNTDMERRGFINHENIRNSVYGRSVSGYFEKDDCEFVYIETYDARTNRFYKLIVSKKYYQKLNMRNRVIVLKLGSGDGSRAVPCVRYNGRNFSIHKADYENKEVDHIWSSLNIITEESLRACTTSLNAKNKENLHKYMKYKNGTFGIEIQEKKDFLSEDNKKELTDRGFVISNNKNSMVIRKRFKTEIEAIKAIREYEERYYGEYAYNPLKDMRKHFDIMFNHLILKTITKEDVIVEMLKSLSNNTQKIARYNLEAEYEKRGIPYKKGYTDEKGNFVY